MFGIGGFELFIILIFGFLIFGPDKLPDIAKTVGKGIARFREAQQEMNEVLGDEPLIDLNNPDQPIKDPMETLDRIAQRQEEKRASASKTAANAASSSKPSAGSSGDEAAPSEPDGEPKQESFTERKARYERERAERKAAEAEAAAAAKAEAEAPKTDQSQSDPSPEPVSEPAPEVTDEPVESPDEGGDA
ncbi:MAG: twin-arginine translocase TatA/TatE family subunit [Eggerthellaceae bacterium]|nr:twin-arginine translocase TatA/TatE family subunit [Eggerthellaceae bacterium]